MLGFTRTIQRMMGKKMPPINFFLLIICPLTAIAMVLFVFPEGGKAFFLVTFLSLLIIFLIRKYSSDKDFLTAVFLLALYLRILLGIVIEFFGLIHFFGGDSVAYDEAANNIVQLWHKIAYFSDDFSVIAIPENNPNSGIVYLTTFIYFIFGRSLFVAQSFCSVVGAALSPMIYFCARQLYDNKQVARVSALLIACFPTFIVWSAQLLKDGPILFLIVFAITMGLILQKRFSFPAIICLIFSLSAILYLRFYIFYMVAASISLGVIIGTNFTFNSLVKRIIAVAILGLGLTYIGVSERALTNYEAYADVESRQAGRQWVANKFNSGYGQDFDVSTFEGAVSAFPIGLAYLFLAPFPWEVNNFRQAITLPEMLVWWCLIPLFFKGIWFTLRTRLRKSIPVLAFALILTVTYALFESDVGTAYRHRTQIQVFMFMFIAVGWTLMQEKREIIFIWRLNRYRRFFNKPPITIKQN